MADALTRNLVQLATNGLDNGFRILLFLRDRPAAWRTVSKIELDDEPGSPASGLLIITTFQDDTFYLRPEELVGVYVVTGDDPVLDDA